MVGLALANCFLMLGLLLSLLAVSAYQNYVTVGDAVDREASALAAFATDSVSYPQPYRATLISGLGAYIKATVELDWPELQHGRIPMAGTNALMGISKALWSFEPVTENQKILQTRSLQRLNDVVEMRRSRVSLAQLGLPPVLWWVVGFGVLMNLCLIWVQDMEIHVHYILGALLSLSLGSVVFVTAVLENPFRGQSSVRPESIQNIAALVQTMARDICETAAPPAPAAALGAAGGCADRISKDISD